MTADGHAKNISLSGVQTVKVDLNDSAKSACWTNLKEARKYAEEKFRIRGIKVVEEYPKRNDRVVFEKVCIFLRSSSTLVDYIPMVPVHVWVL